MLKWICDNMTDLEVLDLHVEVKRLVNARSFMTHLTDFCRSSPDFSGNEVNSTRARRPNKCALY